MSGCPRCDTVLWNVPRYNGIGTDHHVVAYSYALGHCHFGTDPDIVANRDRCCPEASLSRDEPGSEAMVLIPDGNMLRDQGIVSDGDRLAARDDRTDSDMCVATGRERTIFYEDMCQIRDVEIFAHLPSAAIGDGDICTAPNAHRLGPANVGMANAQNCDARETGQLPNTAQRAHVHRLERSGVINGLR